MMPIQLGLAQFLSTAQSNTTSLPSDITNPIAKILGIVYYLILAALLIGIFYYGAMLALGENPEDAKKKLFYVAVGFVVVVLLPRIIDYITGA